MLTAQESVKQSRSLTDAEWILKRGPQTFRPTSTGMVHGEGQLYMLVADYRKVVAHFENALREIVEEGGFSAPEGMKRIARAALAKAGAA